MNNNNIRVAVVGAGRIGKRHIQEILNHPGLELVGACDIKSLLECGLNENLPFYSNIEDLIDSARPDVIHICSPNYLHASQAISAMEMGCHVVIEKPMALNTVDCESVIQTAEKTKKLVFAVMQNRYSPPAQWIKDVLDRKLLGEIYMVDLQCYWNRNEQYYLESDWKGDLEKDGGTIFTQFSHFVDIVYWLFGDIKIMGASFSNHNHLDTAEFEDSGHVLFDLQGQGKGSFAFSTSVDRSNYESGLTIVGEKGTVKIGGQYMNKVIHCDIRDYHLPEIKESGLANDYGSYQGSASNHHFVVENVVNVLTGKDVVKTTALEGMHVVNIIERIYSTGNRSELLDQLKKAKIKFEH